MSSQDFVHLHLHTEFSLLDGALRIKDLVAFAKEQGWKSVAITDHGNVFGAVKFFEEAEKAGIKPILGAEMYFTEDAKVKDSKNRYYHLVLLVKDQEGYENLCQLMAFAYQDGFYFKPRIDRAILKKHSRGLIASGGCLGGQIPSLLREGNFTEAEEKIAWFLDVFGKDNFYFELMPPCTQDQQTANDLLIEYGKKYDVTCVATADTHFLRESDHEAHEVMLSIQTKDLLSNPNRYTFGDFRGHLKTTQEMLDAFPNNPEYITNSVKFAEQCNFKFTFGQLHFPIFAIDTGETPDAYFARISLEGLERLRERNLIAPHDWDAYRKRLDIEVTLICKMGFVGYFLVVSDFMQWAKSAGIPIGPGRGSAAGSIVAWCLQITNVDPIKYNLLFERFLNPERVSMPDIDIDFCIERREEVIEYVRQRYGHECVCQIITFGTMMAKGVIKDVSRVLGIPFSDANYITELIPDQLKITLKEALEQEPKLREMSEKNPQIRQLFDIAFRLEGLTRHASKHAAGVVIAPRALKSLVPLYVPPKTTDLVTQYTMTDLEHLGFLKMDFLGLKNLTIIDRTLKSIKKNHGIDIDLDTIPYDDKPTFKLMGEGKCSGIFQFEGEGVTEVIKKLKPEKFEDLIAVNALYRPGPLGSGMVDDFINRRHGKTKTVYMFPELEPILSETYGVIVYQEQVQKIAAAIGGYSLGGADLLRRAMGKKKPEEMEKQKSIFLAGAEKLGFNLKHAAELFELMAYFAGYGFNKSHSAAYAMIAYQTAYLKTHYHYEFMAALLSFEVNNPDQFALYLQRTKEYGITIFPPNVNTSQVEFAPLGDGILFGLNGIKNVGHAALENILKARGDKPFLDLFDFCKRVDLRTVNKRVIESLIAAGAFDLMPGNRAQKTNDLEIIIQKAQACQEQALTGQLDVFGQLRKSNSSEEETHIYTQLDEWQTQDMLDREKATIGVYLSNHPLTQYQTLAQLLEVDLIASEPAKGATKVSLIGLVQHTKIILTKKNDKMAFAELEDLSGKAELVFFPRTFTAVESTLFGGKTIFFITGTREKQNDTIKILVDTLLPLDEILADEKIISSLKISLPEVITEEILLKIAEQLSPGNLPITLSFDEHNKCGILELAQKFSLTIARIESLILAGCKIQLTRHKPNVEKPIGQDFRKTFKKAISR